MKNIKISIKGKNYTIRPDGLILAGVCAVTAIGSVVYMNGHKYDRSIEVVTVSADEQGALDPSRFEGSILTETEEADADYYETTLFIGDTNTARFLTVENEEGDPFSDIEHTIGVPDMTVERILDAECIEFSTTTATIPEAVEILQPERVILSFGYSDIENGTDSTVFIQDYEEAIEGILEQYPSVDIIVNAIAPVSEHASVTMTEVNTYNLAIATMCKDYDWKYLNSTEVLLDEETGYAVSGSVTSDGASLTQEGLETLFVYLSKHTYITEDDRPKPLTQIPEVIGVIEDAPVEEEVQETAEATATPSATATAVATPTPTSTATATPSTQTCWDGSVISASESCPIDIRTEAGCTADGKYWYNGECYSYDPSPSESAASATEEASSDTSEETDTEDSTTDTTETSEDSSTEETTEG